MITFSLDQTNEAAELNNRDIYPEWAKREKLYNCDDFYQSLSKEKFYLLKWFHKKAVNKKTA